MSNITMSNASAAGTSEPIQKLPIETIQHILGYVDAKSLGNFRLTCRRLARDARPLLCRNINVTETPESFQGLLKLSRQGPEIASSVRSLTYVPFTLLGSRLGRDGYNMKLQMSTWQGTYQHLCNTPNLLAPFDEYEGLIEDRAAFARTSSNTEFLVKALRYIKPHTIDIFDVGGGWWARGQSNHALFKQIFDRMLPLFDNCSSRPQNEEYFIATRSFVAVLAALAQSGYPLFELKARTTLMMLMNPSIDLLAEGVQKLKKLDLDLLLLTRTDHYDLPPTDDWDFQGAHETHQRVPIESFSPGRTPPGTWTFGKFLSNATSVRELTLRMSCFAFSDMDHSGSSIVNLQLNSFVLPHLTSLTLEGMLFSHDDVLLPFLAHQKTLRRLKLHSANLYAESGGGTRWPTIFKQFRKHVQKGEIVLDELSLTGSFGAFIRRFGTSGTRMGTESANMDNDADEFGFPGRPLGERVADFVLGITSEYFWSVYDNIIEDWVDVAMKDPEDPADYCGYETWEEMMEAELVEEPYEWGEDDEEGMDADGMDMDADAGADPDSDEDQ